MMKLDLDGNLLKRTAALESQMATKANVDFSNATKPYVTETYKSGSNFYILFSDGFLIQGGVSAVTYAGGNVNLLKSYNNTNYNIQVTCRASGTTPTVNGWGIANSGSQINIASGYAANTNVSWLCSGYRS